MISQEEKDKIAERVIEKEKKKTKDNKVGKIYLILMVLFVAACIIGSIIAAYIIDAKSTWR